MNLVAIFMQMEAIAIDIWAIYMAQIRRFEIFLMRKQLLYCPSNRTACRAQQHHQSCYPLQLQLLRNFDVSYFQCFCTFSEILKELSKWIQT